MAAWRFKIVFDKLHEQSASREPEMPVDANDAELLRETEDIAELKRLVLDLGEGPDISYTTT